MKELDLKIALLLSAILFCRWILLVPYQLESFQSLLNSSDYAKISEEIPFSIQYINRL